MAETGRTGEMSQAAGLTRARGTYLALRDRISRGEIRPGERFPGEPVLASKLGVSRVTLRRALDRLEAEGLIERRAGSGTYLRPSENAGPMIADLANVLTHLVEMGRKTAVKLIAFAYHEPAPEIAAALGLAPGERVQRSIRVRLIDGEPFSYLVTSVPERIGIHWSEADLSRRPLLELLERAGVPADRATQTISATLASPDVASELATEPGAALLALTRTVYDPSGRGIEHLQALYRPDRHSFQMDLVRTGYREGRRWQPVVAPAGLPAGLDGSRGG